VGIAFCGDREDRKNREAGSCVILEMTDIFTSGLACCGVSEPPKASEARTYPLNFLRDDGLEMLKEMVSSCRISIDMEFAARNLSVSCQDKMYRATRYLFGSTEG